MRKISTLSYALFFALLSVPAANAVTLGGLELGDQKIDVKIDIDDPRAAVSSNGFVYVVGNEGGQGARQVIDLTTGTISAVETFASQQFAQTGGGDLSSFLFGVSVLANGQIVYSGSSSNGFANSPTVWSDPSSPTAAGGSSNLPGIVGAVSPSGTIAGYLTGIASVGSLASGLQNLPGASPGSAIVDISSDDKYIVGSGIWLQTNAGDLNYSLVDTSIWESPSNGLGGTPSQFEAVLAVDDGYLFVGEYLDANLFTSRVGIWDEEGKFLGGTNAGDTFADIGLFDGEIVIGVNGDSGGALYSLADLSSLILLSDLLGSPTTLVEDSFFVGSLGFLAQSNSGLASVSFELSPSGNTVPEPASGLLLLLGIPIARRKRRGSPMAT